MGLTWRLVKGASRLNPDWRASIKQFENFHKKDHYYSPIPLISEVQKYEQKIFDRTASQLAGIDLNVDEQRNILRRMGQFYHELPFTEQTNGAGGFCLDNKFYPYTDAILYYGIMRLAKPARIVEIGSGFSSAACLEINRLFFQQSIQCTFIEPDTSRLDRLLDENEKTSVTLKKCVLQDVPLSEFAKLQSNDILFIDSSHVCKVNSDVNRLLFEVLPSLTTGVYIHFHDIFYPFEYPKEWVYRGVAWNEAYILRAFLQFNDDFEIVAWSDYLQRFHERELQALMPLCRRNSGSFWLRRKG